jgi:hypothetical protein
MSITTKPTPSTNRHASRGSAVRQTVARAHPAPHPTPTAGPPAGDAVTLFEIPFVTAMSDSDLALLARTLDLSTRMHPKLRPRHNSPGLARLDHYSGLFLNRGVVEGQWMLEARTWGRPAAQSVHEWHVLAAGAAHQLDSTVTLPERLSASSPVSLRCFKRSAMVAESTSWISTIDCSD